MRYPAVDGKENILSVGALTKPHVVPKPALHAAALIVIRAGAFFVVFLAALETADIEFPHIVARAIEILDKLAVCHNALLSRCPVKLFPENNKPSQKTAFLVLRRHYAIYEEANHGKKIANSVKALVWTAKRLFYSPGRFGTRSVRQIRQRSLGSGNVISPLSGGKSFRKHSRTI